MKYTFKLKDDKYAPNCFNPKVHLKKYEHGSMTTKRTTKGGLSAHNIGKYDYKNQ